MLIIFTVLALGALLFAFLGGPLVTLASPLWKGENAGSRAVGGFFQYWRTKQGLINDNAALKEKVASLDSEVSTLNLALSERSSLTTLLGRTARPDEVVASVLTRPPQSPYDLFVIDAGKNQGVTVGARVRLPEGPLLGIVSDVFGSSAKVKLFTTSGEKTAAILERGSVPVTLEGKGGGNFRISVPRETPVEVGDRVISAEAEANLVGVVKDIKVSPTDSFKEVLATSPASIFSIRFVTIAR